MFAIDSISVSKNSKYLLICVSENDGTGRSTNKYVILCDTFFNIIQKYDPPTQATISYNIKSGYIQVLSGFS
jgi:hypothetical protein